MDDNPKDLDQSSERNHVRRVFHAMLTARVLENKLGSLYKAGKIVGGVYLGKGQEAVSASMASCLEKGRDVYAPLIRDQAGRTAFGEEILDNTDGIISEGVVAVLFAPGEALAGQSRGFAPNTATECGSTVIQSGKNLAANYLDTLAGIDNAVLPDFITAAKVLDVSSSFNDNMVTILTSEL